MINEYGALCGMRISCGNWSIWRKPTSMSLCPAQISHYLMWDWTWAAVAPGVVLCPLAVLMGHPQYIGLTTINITILFCVLFLSLISNGCFLFQVSLKK
jgi:hypothetical protein